MNRKDSVYHGDVFDVYDEWDTPVVIVSDGAYGVNGFDDDPRSPDELAEWYEPHVKEWTKAANVKTTLWFWNTEQGWANVHPVLKEYGWEYRGANTWNKGLRHIAGNCNLETMRKFPQVTEVCVQYVFEQFELNEEAQQVRDWLRKEWSRTGLTLDEANKACGVADAASRKYFATDAQWYPPPPEKFKRLKEYANEHGDPDGKPYFELPDDADVEVDERIPHAKFDLPAGVTNVWDEPPVSRREREWDNTGGATHPNQKPLKLMKRIIEASSDEGDIVWEPFGGLCTASVAATQLNRIPLVAEKQEEYHEIAVKRLENVSSKNGQTSINDF